MTDNPGSIVVVTGDLQKLRPDITDYLFTDQEDYSDQIAMANREELRNISKQLRLEYPEHTEAEIGDLISKIKDHPVETPLKDRRVYLTLANIFGVNNLLDEAAYFRDLAKAIPLRYYIDANDDNVQGSDETRELDKHRITFGR